MLLFAVLLFAVLLFAVAFFAVLLFAVLHFTGTCSLIAPRWPALSRRLHPSRTWFRPNPRVYEEDHVADIFALNEGVATAAWALTLDAARRLDAVLRPDGMTLFQANREAGWQDVFHFHIHLVPRWNGDSLVRPWRHASGDPQRLDDLADRLREG